MERTKKESSYLGIFLAALTIFAKSSKLVVVFKAFKFTKPLVTVISMAISAIAYGLWLGPWFGVGLVAMLFIHEMGHIVALRLKGYKTSGPLFIPFLGAVIFAPKFRERDTEAFVGFGGPLLGTVGAVGCLIAWQFSEGKTAEILLLVSYLGIFLNLFNMIPISPLDGGRVTQAIGGWFKYLGLGILLVYSVAVRHPGVLLIWILILDAFSTMPLWLRPALSSALGIAMAGLLLFGYGDPQPWYMTLVDCLAAAGMIALYFSQDADRKEKGLVEQDKRVYPSALSRTKWLFCYVALTITTSGVLLWQVQHLPHEVHQHSEKITTPMIQ